MSEHAVLAACNQSTNRDPVVDYDQVTVRLALRGLREQGLARTVHRSGERAEKHRHLLAEGLGLAPAAQAVLSVLVLRGPQTAAELRARTERWGDVGDVEAVLAELAARPAGGALARRLDRAPGQKKSRWVDLLADEPATAAASAPATPSTEVAARTPLERLAEEVAALRAEVAELRAAVASAPRTEPQELVGESSSQRLAERLLLRTYPTDVEKGRLQLTTREAAWERLRALFDGYRGPSLVAELLRERRDEAAQELSG